MASKLKDKMGSQVKDAISKQTASKDIAKPRKSLAPTGPVSAANDEVDEIYKEEDPIESSINIRKKSGNIMNNVPDKNAKAGKFFFTLKVKGDPVKITEAAKKNVAIAEGRVDASGNVIEEEKP